MKTSQSLLLFLCAIIFSLSSCRTENDIIIDPPVEEAISANSIISNLISKTAANDGSFDNIIDNASCLSIQLPVTVTVNGVTLNITNTDGYQEIEDLFDLFDDDVDSLVISYPITIILPDYSTAVINNDTEFASYTSTCDGDDEYDDDIECIDFQYPITASVFNASNDLIATITINNDLEMYEFIEDLDDYAAVTINFPITVILADGTTQSIANIQELETAIEMAEDTCDEDDDNDYNDDDCDNCSTGDLDLLFADCVTWTIDDLEINDMDLEDNYSDYTFTFNSDGTITILENGNNINGTWSASGMGNNIIFTIDIPTLPELNNSWNLHEIERESGEAKFELELGDDELEFESDC